MTKGFPAKVIIMFAIPLMLGNILQQLYNVTDSKIVSESIESGLAAIGATAVVSNLLINFICGLTQGFGIMIARSFGEKDYVSLRRYVAGTVKLTSVVTVLFTVVFLIVIRPVLVLLNTPADILDDAVSYVRIIIAGLVFVALYNMSANILRSMGDSKRPLICLIIGIVVNVGLDILFVIVLKTGITGAAYATVISQFIAGICCFLLIIIKYRHIIPKKDEWKPNRQQYGSMIAAGSSMALMGCIVSIGTVILQSGINGLGTDYVTAHIAGRRVFDIMMVMIFTIGLSMTTYVSQNLGAGEYGRIRKGIWHAIVIDTIIASALVVFAYTLGGRVVKWVASTDNEEVVSAGIKIYQGWRTVFLCAGTSVYTPLFPSGPWAENSATGVQLPGINGENTVNGIPCSVAWIFWSNPYRACQLGCDDCAANCCIYYQKTGQKYGVSR